MKIYNVPPSQAAGIVGLSVNKLANMRSADDRSIPWVKRDSRVFYCLKDLEAYAASGDYCG